MQFEYCEVDFDGSITSTYIYDEAGEYIDKPVKHARPGVVLAMLGHDGWEVVSAGWHSKTEVTYLLKRTIQQEWTAAERSAAEEKYLKNHRRDRRY